MNIVLEIGGSMIRCGIAGKSCSLLFIDRHFSQENLRRTNNIPFPLEEILMNCRNNATFLCRANNITYLRSYATFKILQARPHLEFEGEWKNEQNDSPMRY